MKTSIIICLLIFLILSMYPPQGKVTAQSNSSGDIVTAPNAMYVELLGQGVALSANYERMLFATTPHNISLRAGFGIWVGIESGGVVVPIDASYLFGSNHKLEIGIGFAFISGRYDYNAASFALIGYRYQPIDGGFLIRVSFTPRFSDEFEPWVGLGLGYAF
jgi:hypothetical protein